MRSTIVYENFQALKAKIESELAKVDLPGVNEAEEGPSGKNESGGP
jgi:hypothetical protein